MLIGYSKGGRPWSCWVSFPACGAGVSYFGRGARVITLGLQDGEWKCPASNWERGIHKREIQARLWDLANWGSEASVKPEAGSHTSQGSGAKDSGGI